MLAYEMKGKGSPVLLLHAFPLSSQMWRREIEILSASYKVIAPDFPGFGGSSAEKPASIAEMAKAVKVLLDDLGVREPVFIAGLSMGGYAVFEFLRQFPERVKGLGLFSTRALADTPETREKRFKGIEAIQAHGLEAYGKKMVENLLGETTRRAKPEITEEVMKMILANKPEGPINGLKALADRRDSTSLLPAIHFPVLIAAGEEDTIVKPEDARTLHSQIEDSVLKIIPKAGHLINLEQPAEFQKILLEFLEAEF